jgi:acyl-coenzyme A synthetase/AMP-(fatty) acid ligase
MKYEVGDSIVPKNVRLAVAEDPSVGVGNFIHKLQAASPRRDVPSIFLNEPYVSITGREHRAFSLTSFKREAEDLAALYYALGVREKDPVAIYIEEGVANYLHLCALTSLGAIAVLINGAMPPGAAAAYMRRVRVTAAFLGAEQEKALGSALSGLGLQFVLTHARARQRDERRLPVRFPYTHHPEDVCLICHSSGTTGDSKPVFELHGQFFEGTRRRLREGWLNDSDRVVSTLPHSHSAGVTFFMASVTTGTPLLVVSDYHARVTLPEIQAFEGTVVVGFTRTFVELAAADLAKADLSRVRRWVNVGDASHEKHIRVLVQYGSRIDAQGRRVAGAEFMDGFGSTEMAFSLFQKVFTKESGDYGRCLGKPHPIAEAAVISEDGELLGPNQVGRLGVKSPSVTRGYWNESVLTSKARVQGFWLTGDLVYRDNDGNYYHMDRTTDVVTTEAGPFYTLAAEERLLLLDPDITDACVLGIPNGTFAKPVGIVLLRRGSKLEANDLLSRLNDDLRERSLAPLARIVVADEADPWPIGATGKVIKRHLRERFQQPEVRS